MSPARATAILQKIVEADEMFRSPFSKKHRYFEGSVEGDHFKINRIIDYRNSFLPIIEGRFRGEDSGSRVTLNMREAWPVIVFWVGFMLVVLWSFVKGGSRGLIAMMLFAYFMATVFFAIEVRVAMKTLTRLLRSGGTR
jgi:hypothetical protein